jgi:hypothetical protein
MHKGFLSLVCFCVGKNPFRNQVRAGINAYSYITISSLRYMLEFLFIARLVRCMHAWIMHAFFSQPVIKTSAL